MRAGTWRRSEVIDPTTRDPRDLRRAPSNGRSLQARAARWKSTRLRRLRSLRETFYRFNEVQTSSCALRGPYVIQQRPDSHSSTQNITSGQRPLHVVFEWQGLDNHINEWSGTSARKSRNQHRRRNPISRLRRIDRDRTARVEVHGANRGPVGRRPRTTHEPRVPHCSGTTGPRHQQSTITTSTPSPLPLAAWRCSLAASGQHELSADRSERYVAPRQKRTVHLRSAAFQRRCAVYAAARTTGDMIRDPIDSWCWQATLVVSQHPPRRSSRDTPQSTLSTTTRR